MIGAGLSGITAGILLPAKVPGIDLTIFDKNADFVSTLQAYIPTPANTVSGRHMVVEAHYGAECNIS